MSMSSSSPSSLSLPSETFVLERCLFRENNVWIYRVPATHVTSLAPRADAWDIERPLLTGSMCIMQTGDACVVQLFESPVAPVATHFDAPRLFAHCPLEITRALPLDVYVHDCVDSSRYFMLRVTDDQSGRRAFVGIGFPDRTTAFNFKATVQDYAKYALRQEAMQEREGAAADGSEEEEGHEGSRGPPPSTLSLPEGATIRLKLKTTHCSDERDNEARARPSDGAGSSRCSGQGSGATGSHVVPLIPPPPSESLMTALTSAVPPVVAEAKTQDDEEDWGDFTSA
ncbi:unnamed protein product [Hyaloperonospora brassicae]|uniref:NECAP PHear domain-containing protein n=1 Tax=Hyaloperonospora brassicae TaxID=162125 RepID=A0AAV0T8I5_HYABA|nr:unnamed protein product [Hyaloperonospora brassicae]